MHAELKKISARLHGQLIDIKHHGFSAERLEAALSTLAELDVKLDESAAPLELDAQEITDDGTVDGD